MGEIVIQNLDKNPGIIPVRLGNAHIQQHTHTLIHYYDLQILEKQILHNNANFIVVSGIINEKNFSNDLHNHLALLNNTIQRVEIKFLDLVPANHSRIKRGLVNGIGSLIKVLTGNLDADDGVRYDNIIKTLEENQKELSYAMIKQSSLNIDAINSFNETIITIEQNEFQLKTRLSQMETMVSETNKFLQTNLLKDSIMLLLNTFEILNSLLQDIENSILFARLKILHPSIIKTSDLLNALQILNNSDYSSKLPFYINSANVQNYERIIKVQSYLSDERLIFLLTIPLFYPDTFEYYRMYPVPIFENLNGKFSTIIPQSKFLLTSPKHVALIDEDCPRIQQEYYCENSQLFNDYDSCEINILRNKPTGLCHATRLRISDETIQQLEDTNRWILILPDKTSVAIQCNNEEKLTTLQGSYLLRVPVNCAVKTEKTHVKNVVIQSEDSRTVIVPEMNINTFGKHENLDEIELKSVDLSKLHNIKYQMRNTKPTLSFHHEHIVYSTYIFYVIFVILFCGIGFLFYIHYNKNKLEVRDLKSNTIKPKTNENYVLKDISFTP